MERRNHLVTPFIPVKTHAGKKPSVKLGIEWSFLSCPFYLEAILYLTPEAKKAAKTGSSDFMRSVHTSANTVAGRASAMVENPAISANDSWEALQKNES